MAEASTVASSGRAVERSRSPQFDSVRSSPGGGGGEGRWFLLNARRTPQASRRRPPALTSTFPCLIPLFPQYKNKRPRRITTGSLPASLWVAELQRSGYSRDSFASEVHRSDQAGRATSCRSHNPSSLPSSPLSSRTHSPFYRPRSYLLISRPAHPLTRLHLA